MSQEILSQIKAWRLLALDRAFIALGSHKVRVEFYRKYGQGSFDTFSLRFHKGLEEMAQSIDVPIDYERLSAEGYSQGQVNDKNQEIAKSIQKVSYEPPTEDHEIIMHLWVMYQLYKNHTISWPPRIEDMILDFSFTKLITRAQRDLVLLTAQAEREETRNLKTTKTKRKKAELWKSIVLAIYEHGERIAARMNLSEVIRMIEMQFEESKESKIKESKREEPKWGMIPDDMKIPKRDSIIGLFKEKDILEKDFEYKGKGKGWFKKM